MERDRILREIASQLEGEIARGISFWTDTDWNRAARDFLATPSAAPTGPLGAAVPPLPSGAPSSGPVVPPKRPGTPSSDPVVPSKRSDSPSPAAAATSRTGGSSAGTAVGARTKAPAKKKPQFGPTPPAQGRDPDWQAQLETLGHEANQCTKCQLSKSRRSVVFNSGSGRVPLVFVGEAPGADEDAQGEAFVGRAGQLLTKIIAAIGLDRKDVYICNVLKCRPPENRNPMSDEIECCSPYLQRQLDILKPRVICTLGLFAAQLLLESKASIGKLRGRVFRYNGIPLMPTYHPAFLLRSPGMKRVVWDDVQLLRKILDEGIETPKTTVDETPGKQTEQAGPQSGDLFG